VLLPALQLLNLDGSRLDLGANRIRALHPLAGLMRLETLRVNGNGLNELHAPARLEGLRDLRPLQAVTSLVWVLVAGAASRV